MDETAPHYETVAKLATKTQALPEHVLTLINQHSGTATTRTIEAPGYHLYQHTIAVPKAKKENFQRAWREITEPGPHGILVLKEP